MKAASLLSTSCKIITVGNEESYLTENVDERTAEYAIVRRDLLILASYESWVAKSAQARPKLRSSSAWAKSTILGSTDIITVNYTAQCRK